MCVRESVIFFPPQHYHQQQQQHEQQGEHTLAVLRRERILSFIAPCVVLVLVLTPHRPTAMSVYMWNKEEGIYRTLALLRTFGQRCLEEEHLAGHS